MENENQGKGSLLKTILIITSVIILAILIYTGIMSALSPSRKYKELREQFSFRQDEKNKVDERIFTDSAYLKLYKEKAYYQSRVTMAETDSIYLAINIPDSTLDLEISGVSVHNVKYKEIEISKIFRQGDDYIISNILSRPFTISSRISSIEKEPLMIKMAPKDTSEFEPDIMPDTADFEPVNYILNVDHGMRILVYQDERLRPGDGNHLFFFDLKYRVRNTLEALRSIFTFKVPEYHPYIKIRLPRGDAKIIYRALPVKGQIGVYL